MKAAGRAARDYLEQVRQVDLSRVGDRSRDPVRVGMLLRSLGRYCAREAKLSTLAADAGGADGPLDGRTVTDYLQALEGLVPTSVGKVFMAVEVKRIARGHRRDLSALRAYREVDPESDCCLVSFAAEPLVMDGIHCEPLEPWLSSLGV